MFWKYYFTWVLKKHVTNVEGGGDNMVQIYRKVLTDLGLQIDGFEDTEDYSFL